MVLKVNVYGPEIAFALAEVNVYGFSKDSVPGNGGNRLEVNAYGSRSSPKSERFGGIFELKVNVGGSFPVNV